MTMKRTVMTMLTVIATCVLCLGTASAAETAAKGEKLRRVLEFDVSELAIRFVFDETPLDANGNPAYGGEFVTEGVIYPPGTLNGSNGVVAEFGPDGKLIKAEPEFPDKVIGRWTCRGWHVGEGAATVTGPWVITHQLYQFGDTPGEATFTTDGHELVDLNVAITRAVTGGTGPYRRMRGEAVQTMLGFNASKGVNLRFQVEP
jgi:hypothetical protein